MPRADAFRWSMDGDGKWLHIKCADPQQILSTVRSGRLYDFEVKEHREKRSLDANALYWKLLTGLAKAMAISNARAHNLMLRRYGQIQEIDGQTIYIFLPDTDEAEEEALEAETFHVKPTSRTKPGKEGVNFRAYLLLKGSSEMDKSDFSRMIDGVIDECKQLGIETMSFYEQELIRQWEAEHDQRVRRAT